MKCKLCNQEMVIIANDVSTEIGTTDIYSTLEFGCTNPKCVSYVGKNLNNPLVSTKGTPIKMN